MPTLNAPQKDNDTEDEHDCTVRTTILWLVTLLRFVDALLAAIGVEGIAELIVHLFPLWPR